MAASTVQTGSRPVGSSGVLCDPKYGISMTEHLDYQLPKWAPRLRKSEIERLYRSCGRGILDGDLIDDVGFGLFARCKSMLQVAKAIRGRPVCPQCGATAEVRDMWQPNATALCGRCGWECPWPLYKKTYQRKNLNPGGMTSFVREFLNRFSAARSPGEKLVLIDTLIHRFHWESSTDLGGRPGALNLIEGKMKDIMPFLDRLTYGDSIPADIHQTREEWRSKWVRNPWSKDKGQKPNKPAGSDA